MKEKDQIQAKEAEVDVVAIEPLNKKGKTIAVGSETTLPKSAATILSQKNKLKIKG
jgi:hydrogenase maturation factor